MSMEWLTELDAGLAAGKRCGQPVVVAVTTGSDPQCAKFEQETLADPQVQKALARMVCVRLDAEAHADLLAAYGSVTLPVVLVFGADGDFRGMITGLCAPDEFVFQLEDFFLD